MKKILTICLSLLLLPFSVLAADELTFDADTTITVNGIDLTVISGSIVDQMVVNDSSVVFSLSTNSGVVLRSTGRKILNNNLTDYICGDSYSQISLSGDSLGSSLSVSPSSEVCYTTSGGALATASSGGGGTAVSSKPTTTTGQVTATVSGGGKTTLTTNEGTNVSADLPANAVSASTAVKIEAMDNLTVIDSRPAPGIRNVVGGFVYNYTATANDQIISNFNKDVTLNFTYTDDQISGLDESTLKIYYWKESTSQWMAMVTTVDAENNTLTVVTDHFTYFAIMGLSEGAASGEETAGQGDLIIFDGDLIRNLNADGMAQFDIYIVKMINGKSFKRLILSPHVFESYEHFDKNGNGNPWDDVKNVSASTMNQYTISDLVRAANDAKVYRLLAGEGADTGLKQWFNMTAEQFLASYDADSIYEINAVDRDAYVLGADI